MLLRKTIAVMLFCDALCLTAFAENLLENGDFSQWKAKKPVKWSLWSAKGGAFQLTDAKPDGIRITGCADGSLGQRLKVEAGKTYDVSLTGKLTGGSNLRFFVRFFDADGKRMSQKKNVFPGRVKDRWETVSVKVAAPEGSSSMLLLIGIKGQSAQEDSVLLREVAISETGTETK